MPDRPIPTGELVHDLANQLAIAVGFLELTLEATPAGDPRHADLVEARDAAHAAMALVHALAARLK